MVFLQLYSVNTTDWKWKILEASVQKGDLNQLNYQGADRLPCLAGKEMCSSKQQQPAWSGAESGRSLGIACCSPCAVLIKPERLQVEFRFGD